MKQGAPGFAAGRELGTVGRATRFACEPGPDARDVTREERESPELWRMDADADAVGARLLELGQAGVGLFTDGGVDQTGVWLRRAPTSPSLATLLGEYGRKPLPFARTNALIAAVARALAACESRALFPGPLDPAGIVVEARSLLDDAVLQPDCARLRAEPLVRALVGQADDATGASRASAETRWIAPEQAAGAPHDNQGNRYVLALIWYRLLAGRHPFSGAGLRHALERGATSGVPPLPEAVAQTLPPGLHSAVSRALDSDPSRRPGSAEELARLAGSFKASPRVRPDDDRDAARRAANADALEALRERRAARSGRAPDGRRTERQTLPREPDAPRRPRRLGLARAISLGTPLALAGAALIYWLVASHHAHTDDRAARVPVERAPLTQADTRAEACATCHPRQVAEWRRSIMAHSAKSPLFQALEMLIQEQAGKSFACPGGAGVLRSADPATACRTPGTNVELTGSGGPLWCVNCHAPAENLGPSMPAWNGLAANSASRRPLRDILPASAMEGISCAFCHQVHGPVAPGLPGYQGNPFWTSARTGQRLSMRPEDGRGLFGIANSGYRLDPNEFLAAKGTPAREMVPGGAHRRPSAEAAAYLRSSEFCGACHDVRLFGSDVIGARLGEHFKRLRNAYTEWTAWRDMRKRTGREVFTCQDCHMSEFPGVCLPGAPDPAQGGSEGVQRTSSAQRACPEGTHFAPREPGSYPLTRASVGSARARVTSHYFSGVDLPLATSFDPEETLIDDTTVDATGIPLGARQRRDILLGQTFRLDVGEIRLDGVGSLRVPIELENVGAGHRVPAGFSQEREIWVHMRVTDASGAVLYEVGRVDSPSEDLRDKIFVRVNTDDTRTDRRGQPLGLFGADVIDGPDHPEWQPPPDLGGREFAGKGLINLQNGFLRCVRCIGVIDADGRCQPDPNRGQGATHADRYADGGYDADTGACVSNLAGREALFEIFFPVGALDASRGVTRGPDAIIDTRSLAPEEAVRYTYQLALPRGARGPFTVEARLLFRAFPPFLVRAFADYEERMNRRGARPSGPLITHEALERLEIVEVARVRRVGP